MERLRELWYFYLIAGAIVSMVAAITRQWGKVNHIHTEQDRMKEMFGRWQDKSQTQYDKISDELSKLQGSFETFFKMWIKKNGK